MTTTVLDAIAEPILIDGLSWQDFKSIEKLIDRPGVRLSFLDGVLELRKMPGRQHETVKKRIAALLEIYLEFKEFDFTPTGSMTLESEAGSVKREADESYELGSDRSQPDLAIEVVVTSGGIDKLEAYKRLAIPEVWIWQNGNLSLFAWGANGYEPILQSTLLPNLDMDLFKRCLEMPKHSQSLREFRKNIVDS